MLPKTISHFLNFVPNFFENVFPVKAQIPKTKGTSCQAIELKSFWPMKAKTNDRTKQITIAAPNQFTVLSGLAKVVAVIVPTCSCLSNSLKRNLGSTISITSVITTAKANENNLIQKSVSTKSIGTIKRGTKNLKTKNIFFFCFI